MIGRSTGSKEQPDLIGEAAAVVLQRALGEVGGQVEVDQVGAATGEEGHWHWRRKGETQVPGESQH